MSKKIKVLLLACVLAVICCVGFTVGATDEAKAEVKGHSLTITDTGISVNFYVAIQGDVQVTLNENEVDLSTMETEKIVIDAKAYDCYIFTEAVAAKEMGDVVTLKIVSGTTPLINDSYRVNDYVAEVQKGGYNYNFESLANAMTYYGEFAEVYFGYNGATSVSPNANSYIEDFKESYFDSYAASVNTANMPDGLEFYGTMLNLNSKTTLRLLFTVDGKEASSFGTFTANGEDLGQLKQYKTYYYVDIEGIGAAQLDKAYTIKCGDAEIISNCSVLTYARAAVKSTKESLVNLSKALYLYNQKANTYVDAQKYAVYDMFYNGQGFYADPACETEVYLMPNGTDYPDVTTNNTGEKIDTLGQLNGSRTKGYSVWMKEAYTVSENESLTGPYVIRRYTDNDGNVLNVTGTATLNATVNGSEGVYIAQYPGGRPEVEISDVENGEVSVSGTLNVTGSARTGVVTVEEGNNINANGLTAEGEVIFASHKGVNLSGNAEVSAIKLLDDGMGHFDIVKHNNNVRVASVICVCGDDVTGKTSHDQCVWAGEEGISKVYDIAWQPWSVADGKREVGNSRLPSKTGSYYLVENFSGGTNQLRKFPTINGEKITLDLNGFTAASPAALNSYIYKVKSGSLTITDSKTSGKLTITGEAKNAGAIIRLGDDTTSKPVVNLYGGTLATASNIVGYDGMVMDIYNGTFNMYGGRINPGNDVEGGSNCIKVGNGTNTTIINAQAGVIAGEIIINSSSAQLNISNKAQVGVEDTGKAYGIGTSSAVTSTVNITYNNVISDGDVVLKNTDYLSIASGSTGDESAFAIIDPHNKVVDASGGEGVGELSYTARMCNCGALEDGTHKYRKNGTLRACSVPATAWKAWNENISKAADSSKRVRVPWQSGSYYFTENITLTNDVVVNIQTWTLNLDLNGKTITASNSATRMYALANGYGAVLNITDSAEGGKIQFPQGTSSKPQHLIAMLGNSSTLNWFGGTLTAEGATSTYTDGTNKAHLIYKDQSKSGQFYWFGGRLIQNSSISAYSATNGFNNIGKLEIETAE